MIYVYVFFNFTWMSNVFFCVFAKPWELSLLLITLVYLIAEPLSYGINMCAQLCLTLWDPMDCSLPGSSLHGSFQKRILKQVAVSSSRGSSWTGIEAMSLGYPALADGFFPTEPSWKPCDINLPLYLSILLRWLVELF